ncbi:MAG: sigma-70 family RNA polymerase sigma factor [Myxococcales bacterium]|nr:sigma-70 family RNA polymerase sigma factor [Myxococcales bacterium]
MSVEDVSPGRQRIRSDAKLSAGEQDRLVRDFASLIVDIARRVSRRIGHSADVDDLVSEGTIGLLQAAERYDVNRQVKFEAYASTRIHGAMLDYLRHLDPLSQRRRREASRVRRAEERLSASLGRPATSAEVARELAMPLSQYLRLMAEFAAQGATSESDLLVELKSETPNQEEHLAGIEDQSALRRHVEALGTRHRQVLLMVYFYDFSQKEVAKVLGVSEPRVSQLRKEAVERLRTATAGLDAYALAC